jgi:hypothetical protein
MIKENINNKKAVMSISLIIWVFFLFVIIAIVVGSFIVNEKNNEFFFQTPTEVDYVSNEAMNLDYYFQDLFDRTLLDVNPSSASSAEFIEKFKENMEDYNPYTLNKYKDEITYGLKEDNLVRTDDGSYSLKINLILKNERKDGSVTVVYPYNRVFYKTRV